MANPLLGSLLAFIVIGLIGAVAAEATRPIWRARPHLAWAYAIVGIALVGWVEFLITWASSQAGTWAAFAILGVTLVAAGRLRVFTAIRRNAGVVTLALGLLVVYLGLLYLWRTPAELDVYSVAALRFAFGDQPYPADNILPYFLADAIGKGQSTHGFFLSWNGSDRPPLQAGIVLLMIRAFGASGLPGDAVSFGAGFVLQLVWVPTVWVLLATVRIRPWVRVLTVLFVGATATMIINTTYTWPKLLSACLVILALCMLIEVCRRRYPLTIGLPVAGLAVALAMLSHGAAAFALPAVVVIAAIAVVRGRRRLLSMGVALVVVVATYLPWTLYQRFFDPPGDRLLKWHLAGVIELTDRSFSRTLLDSYAGLDVSDFVHAKLTNLGLIVSPFIAEGFTGRGEASLGSHRYHEYYETSAALSVAAVLIVAIALYAVLQLVRRRPLREVRALRLMLLMLPCVLFWWLLMFLPGGTVVHQGSHVWIIVLIALSFAWFASLKSWLGWSLIVVQAGVTAWFYVPFFHFPELRPTGLALLMIGLAVLAGSVAVLAVRRHRGLHLA